MAIPPESVRVRFGTALRKARDRAGLTQTQLATRAGVVQSHVSAIELGKKNTTSDYVSVLDKALSAKGALVDRWHELHQSGDGYAAWFVGTAEMEKTASAIQINAPLLVPGLLQTAGYARTLTRFGDLAAADEEIEEQVRGRLDRQTILTAGRGPVLTAVLDESALIRNVGGSATMAAQLDHLIRASAQPRISVHVMEMGSAYQPGLDGAFDLYTVPGKGTLVYTETRTSGHPEDGTEAVNHYAALFGELRGAALSPDASRERMEEIRREHHDDDR